jgi:uncharacterized protein YegP (UPF0339 family)
VILLKSKYQVYKDIAGNFRFRLRAANNKIIAVSEAYESKANCMNGIKSVQNNCKSHIEDKTAKMDELTHPKYEVFTDVNSEFRFHLKASNGEIIAASEGYETKQGAMKGIEAVQNSCDSEIEDLTVDQETKDKELAAKIEKTCSSEVTTEDMTYLPYQPVEVCKEPAPGVNATTIILDSPPKVVKSGDKVTFLGKLRMAKSGEGIGCVTVHIFERDRSFMRDDLLAHGQTKPDGTFAIDWTAKQKDFWDDKIQVYAKFIGTTNYAPSNSDVNKMQVQWYAKDHLKE